ncbi:MAG: DUF4340 domain-containing protein [Cyanobacteria bacterium P01_D01_bin.71]
MKLQRSTVILVAIALLLGGVVLFTQARQSVNRGSTTAQGDREASPVFDFEETDVVGLKIETDDQPLVFEKDDAGFWQMVEPEAQPAEEAAIAFLLSRLVTDGLVQTTTADAVNQAEFGLDNPFSVVELTLADNTTHTLILGSADFSGQNYYALIDPEAFPLPEDAGDVDVAIVTENIFNGVDRPLEEWQAPADAAEDAEEAEVPTPEEDAAEADDTAEDIDEAGSPAGDASDAADDAATNDATENAPAADNTTDAASEDDTAEGDPEASGTNSEDTDSETENSDTTDAEDSP